MAGSPREQDSGDEGASVVEEVSTDDEKDEVETEFGRKKKKAMGKKSDAKNEEDEDEDEDVVEDADADAHAHEGSHRIVEDQSAEESHHPSVDCDDNDRPGLLTMDDKVAASSAIAGEESLSDTVHEANQQSEVKAKRREQLKLLKANKKKHKKRISAKQKTRRREKAEEVEKAYLSMASWCARPLDGSLHRTPRLTNDSPEKNKAKELKTHKTTKRVKSRRRRRRSSASEDCDNASDGDHPNNRLDKHAPSEVVAEMASLGSELSVPHVGIGDGSHGHANRGELVIPKSEAEISANEFASLQASDQRVSALKADMQRLHVAFVHEREVDEETFLQKLDRIVDALHAERKSLHRVQSSCNEAREHLHQELEDRSRAAREARIAQKKRLALPSPAQAAGRVVTTTTATTTTTKKKNNEVEEVKPKRRPGPVVAPNPQASLLANLPRGMRSPVRSLHESKLLAPVRSDRR